jgi:anaerobic magnesium-protoporphyrin IX monomethyl ester cyclase
MRKIVLVNPPFASKPEPQVPLSIMAASALLAVEGYKIDIVNGSMDAGFVNKAVESCSDAVCIGISAMTGFQIKGGLAVSSAVRENFPNLPIVWGGWHSAILPRETVYEAVVDAVVIGQGERALYELVKTWETGNGELGEIAGIGYKKSGQTVLTAMRQFENINNFPSMPYHLVDVEPILRYRAQNGQGRIMEYSSSQGCPNGCTFCAEPLVMHRRWSGLAADRVVSEWKFLSKKYELNAINLVDSNFFVDCKRVEAICRGVINEKLHITWHNANATINYLTGFDSGMWKLLYASGCRSILVGAESGSQDMLELVDKKCTVEDILTVAELSRRYGIEISFSFMTGLPPEKSQAGSEREFKDTVRLIYDILRIDKRHDIKLFLYTPYPGTPLYLRSLELGLQAPQRLEDWSNYELINITTPWIKNGFKDKVDMVRRFAIPYFRRDNNGAYGISDMIKKLLIYLLGLRLKYGFFGLPVDYWLVKKHWKHKGFDFDKKG